jgi:hypothetical protein
MHAIYASNSLLHPTSQSTSNPEASDAKLFVTIDGMIGYRIAIPVISRSTKGKIFHSPLRYMETNNPVFEGGVSAMANNSSYLFIRHDLFVPLLMK